MLQPNEKQRQDSQPKIEPKAGFFDRIRPALKFLFGLSAHAPIVEAEAPSIGSERPFEGCPFTTFELRTLLRQMETLSSFLDSQVGDLAPMELDGWIASLPHRLSKMAFGSKLPLGAKETLSHFFFERLTAPFRVEDLNPTDSLEASLGSLCATEAEKGELAIFLDQTRLLIQLYSKVCQHSLPFPISTQFETSWNVVSKSLPSSEKISATRNLAQEILVLAQSLANRGAARGEKGGFRLVNFLDNAYRSTGKIEISDFDTLVRDFVAYWEKCTKPPAENPTPGVAEGRKLPAAGVEPLVTLPDDPTPIAEKVLGNEKIQTLDLLYRLRKTPAGPLAEEVLRDITPDPFISWNLDHGRNLGFYDCLRALQVRNPMPPFSQQTFLSHLSLNLSRILRSAGSFFDLLKDYNLQPNSDADSIQKLEKCYQASEIRATLDTAIGDLDDAMLDHYLMAYFSLDPESSMALTFTKDLYGKRPLSETAVRSLMLDKGNETLLLQCVVNVLNDRLIGQKDLVDTIGLSISETVSEQLPSTRCTLRQIVESLKLMRFIPIDADQINQKRGKRASAIDELDREFPNQPPCLERSRFQFTDDDFKRVYVSTEADPHFLSTNFDLAKVGISNKTLAEEANNYVYEQTGLRKSHPEIEALCKKRFLETLKLPSAIFRQENFHLAMSGTSAFNLFSPYIKTGDTVIMTSDEYKPLLEVGEVGELPKKEIRFVPLGSLAGRDAKSLGGEVRLEIDRSTSDRIYMLVSDITRRGTLNPIDEFISARTYARDQGKKAYLVIDSCQSFCRRKPHSPPNGIDAFFLSSFKAADIGGGGALILSNEFVGPKGEGLLSAHGSNDPILIAKLLVSVCPEAFGVKGELSLTDRESRIQTLSKYFVQWVDAINGQCKNNRLKLLTPSHAYRYNLAQQPIPNLMTGIFECEVDGCTREALSQFALEYGVHIAEDYEDPASPTSIRVAFHPRMGAEAIKLLAYVLMKCPTDR